ncbi:unnamed protein product, partial [marine sediment metagenome]
LVVLEGSATLHIKEKEYSIPNAIPGGEMLIVPASSGSYK